MLAGCDFLVIAHRGASAELPENTLPAFERAAALGADAVELDVQLCEEALVVLHDESLERTTNGSGPLAATPLARLRELDAGGGARVPRLEEVLAAVADRLRPAAPRDEYALRARDVAVIGLAQCLALVLGTSRSGITMTAALAMALSRSAAARFSFLLSIPTIAGAAVLSLGDLLEAAAPVPWDALATGFLAAALSAWACIRFFLALLERTGFLPYVLYRLLLGAVLLLFFA